MKCDGTHAENRFRLSAKRTSPFKSDRGSVQSTTGSRGLRINGSNAGYALFRGSVKGTGYPLHSPVSPSLPLRASPSAITFQLESTNIRSVEDGGMCLSSVDFMTPRGDNNNDHPLTEITVLKELQLFIEFPSSWLTAQSLLKAGDFFFSFKILKYLFCRLLDCASGDGPTTRSTPTHASWYPHTRIQSVISGRRSVHPRGHKYLTCSICSGLYLLTMLQFSLQI